MQKTTALALLTLSLSIALGASARTTPIKGNIGLVREKAAQSGKTTVIIGVALPEPLSLEDNLLPSQAIARRRADIHASQQKVLKKHPNAHARRTYATIPYLAVEVNAAELERLIDDDDVVDIEEDTEYKPALRDVANIVGASTVWPRFDGTGYSVAILDTGFERSHSFFSGGGKFVYEACFSTNGTDPINGSTYLSVCQDFLEQQKDVPGAAKGCPHGCYHGTLVAGVAAGHDTFSPVGDLGGVARGASIMAISVSSWTGTNFNSGSVTIRKKDVLAALDEISLQITNGDPRFTHLAAVNMSFTAENIYCNSSSSSVVDAVALLKSKGVATVAASGNGGSDGVTTPACLTGVIAVGSTMKDDSDASFSNISAKVEVVAPGDGFPGTGQHIYTAITGHQYGDTEIEDGNHYAVQGTSISAPEVAAAFAVLRQRMPTASVDTLLGTITSTGKPVNFTRTDQSSVTHTYTIPRLDLAAAIGATDTIPPGAVAQVTANATFANNVRVTWSAAEDETLLTKYIVQRRSSSSASWPAPTTAWEVPANIRQFDDTTVAANTTYEYRVLSKDIGGHTTPSSVTDLATTVMFSEQPLMLNDPVRGAHISELRRAVDSWRSFAGLSPAWTDYQAITGNVRAIDFSGSSTSLVNAFNAARTALTLSAFSYTTTPPQSGVAVLKDHVQQLRDALR